MVSSADEHAAIELLQCREDATPREVRAAYRRLLRSARPDVGGADGDWVARVQWARDVLLVCAAPERRRSTDRDPVPAVQAAALRRETWLGDETADRVIDLRL